MYNVSILQGCVYRVVLRDATLAECLKCAERFRSGITVIIDRVGLHGVYHERHNGVWTTMKQYGQIYYFENGLPISASRSAFYAD